MNKLNEGLRIIIIFCLLVSITILTLVISSQVVIAFKLTDIYIPSITSNFLTIILMIFSNIFLIIVVICYELRVKITN